MKSRQHHDSISPLPIKNGVAPNRLWLPEGPWETVFDFFLSCFPHLTVEDCAARFERGEVVTSTGVAFSKTSQYLSGEHLYFYRELKSEIDVPFEEHIVYQDDNILVADKPHFLPVAPTGQYLHNTLLVRLRNKLSIDELELCHRLDRETAGLVLLSKSKQLRACYHSLFAERNITKVYHALAPPINQELPTTFRCRLGKGEPYFRMKPVDGEANSETHVELLEKRGSLNLYQLKPVTGRKHQLRVHMCSLGAPIHNDPIYPQLSGRLPEDFSKPLALLAKELHFVDPLSGCSHSFISKQCL
jgi:tRNA pseudouridine32 synthase/23S rRNA pseudouridine746 synthase